MIPEIITKPKFLPPLNGVRALAVLLVLIAHHYYIFGTPLFKYGRIGALGVTIFFVLSSFLLTRNLLNIDCRLNSFLFYFNYFCRRIFRIYPAYLVVLFLLHLLTTYTSFNYDKIYTFQTIYQHLICAQGFSHFWTLPVEIVFYIFLPLFVFFLNFMFVLPAPFFLFFISMIIFCDRVFCFYSGIKFTDFLTVFLSGILLAYCEPFFHLIKNNKFCNLVLHSCMIIFFIFLFFSDVIFTSLSETLFSCLSFHFFAASWSCLLIYILITNPYSWIRSIFNNSFALIIGQTSFSIYLYHRLIYLYSNYLLSSYTSLTFVIYIFANVALLFVSILSHKYIEKQFLKIRF